MPVKLLDIGVLSKESGIPASTLRYYEEIGLIQSVGRHGLRRQFDQPVVTKLALIYEDNLSFVIGDDLIVRKLKFLDGALDQLEHADEDGRRAEFDARFALQSAEIRRLFLLLEEAFKLSKAD